MSDDQYAKHLRNLGAAWRKGLAASSTSYRVAIAKEYERYATELEIAPPVTPPTSPAPSDPPSGPPVTSWPRIAGPGPTGPKKPLTTKTGDLVTSAPNQVIDGMAVQGLIQIAHPGVTVRNFTCYGVNVQPGATATPPILEDGQIIPPAGGPALEAGVVYWNYTIRRCEIAHTFDGLKAHGNVTAEDCWIHDIDARAGTGNTAGGPHTDAVQISSGVNITIRRCRIERISANGGVFASTDFGDVTNLTVDNCYFNEAGNFALFIVPAGANPSKPYPSNVTITNNQIGPSKLADMGYAWIATKPAPVWSGNVDETGKPIPYLPSSTPNRRVVIGV